LWSNPLYFQDVGLERYGHVACLQPAVSAVKFFGTVPILPYKIGLDPPWACVHTLGYGRPCDCVPPVHEHLPLSLRASAVQAAAATGFVYLFPY
jgi:hypothetical protein